ncbi:MAG TPA: adenine phosphoribosyltransferase [Mycobacteriales bacterium]|nr:adenine phosphoribosyltransferase [Mycobacteriales bacterium]
MSGTQAVLSDADLAGLVASRVREVPDFPEPGIQFKDLMPLFADGAAFRAVTDGIVAHHGEFDLVAGVEARGFLIAAAIGYATGAGVVPVRKQGKLPGRVISVAYTLEYGEAVVEVHADAFTSARRVLLVDDVLATGGTIAAAADLIGRAGGEVVGMSVVLELLALGGRARLAPFDVHAVLAV